MMQARAVLTYYGGGWPIAWGPLGVGRRGPPRLGVSTYLQSLRFLKRILGCPGAADAHLQLYEII
jgi:hypothetical protein